MTVKFCMLLYVKLNLFQRVNNKVADQTAHLVNMIVSLSKYISYVRKPHMGAQ